MAAFNENTDLQFSQLCLLIKKTSLGATQGARQIQTRCCKTARALGSQLPRDLRRTFRFESGHVAENTQQLPWHNLYTNHHMLPFKRRSCAETQIFNMSPQTFKKISVLLVSVWMKTESRKEKVTLKIRY